MLPETNRLRGTVCPKTETEDAELQRVRRIMKIQQRALRTHLRRIEEEYPPARGEVLDQSVDI